MNDLIFTIKRCYKPITENRIWQQMYVQCDFFQMLKCKIYKSRHFSVRKPTKGSGVFVRPLWSPEGYTQCLESSWPLMGSKRSVFYTLMKSKSQSSLKIWQRKKQGTNDTFRLMLFVNTRIYNIIQQRPQRQTRTNAVKQHTQARPVNTGSHL